MSKSKHPNVGNTNSAGPHHNWGVAKAESRAKNAPVVQECQKPGCKAIKRVDPAGGSRGGVAVTYNNGRSKKFTTEKPACVERVA